MIYLPSVVTVAGAAIAVSLAACLGPLLFDLDGPPCPAIKTWLQCACSEGMKWDPEPRAEWYEIRRVAAIQNIGQQVGTTTETHWYFPQDTPLPRPGTLYEYYVRACRRHPTTGEPLCSAEWSAKVRYVASPMLCVKNGAEVPCWPEAPWLTP